MSPQPNVVVCLLFLGAGAALASEPAADCKIKGGPFDGQACGVSACRKGGDDEATCNAAKKENCLPCVFTEGGAFPCGEAACKHYTTEDECAADAQQIKAREKVNCIWAPKYYTFGDMACAEPACQHYADETNCTANPHKVMLMGSQATCVWKDGKCEGATCGTEYATEEECAADARSILGGCKWQLKDPEKYIRADGCVKATPFYLEDTELAMSMNCVSWLGELQTAKMQIITKKGTVADVCTMLQNGKPGSGFKAADGASFDGCFDHIHGARESGEPLKGQECAPPPDEDDKLDLKTDEKCYCDTSNQDRQDIKDCEQGTTAKEAEPAATTGGGEDAAKTGGGEDHDGGDDGHEGHDHDEGGDDHDDADGDGHDGHDHADADGDGHDGDDHGDSAADGAGTTTAAPSPAAGDTAADGAVRAGLSAGAAIGLVAVVHLFLGQPSLLGPRS